MNRPIPLRASELVNMAVVTGDLSVYIAELLKEPDLPAMVARAHTLSIPIETSGQASVLYELLPASIGANNRRSALAYSLALMRLEGAGWVARMRKDGLFRASRYGFDGGCLKKIVQAALQLSVVTPLPAEQIQYLRSVRALLDLAKPARQIHRSLCARLKSRKGAGLKSLLALVNSSFSVDWVGDGPSDEGQSHRWTCTDLASAFSRLYMISRDEIGIGARAWTWVDDSAASLHEGIYSSMLVDALKLNELIDAEVLIDGLPYKAEHTSAGVLVSAIDPDFERSVRLGYIQSDLQLQIRVDTSQQHQGGDHPKLTSFHSHLSEHIEAGLLECVSLKDQPVERLVIELPVVRPLIDFLNFDGLFLEEHPWFFGALIDNFQPEGRTTLQVGEHLTIMDVTKAQRLFLLIDALYRKKLELVVDPVKRRVLELRSTVIVTARPDLQRMLELVMPPENAREMIAHLSLPTINSTVRANFYIDLQYKPFVRSMSVKGDYVAIPPAMVAKSNLVRSIMHASGIKGAMAAADPMQVAVASALRTAGFLVRESFVFNINGKRETDIFCYRDGTLVVIECKNAYHPCSPHELRNSYDLVLKAEEQLDIRGQWLLEPRHQSRLFNALGWEAAVPALVRTCVVTANRAFSGYHCGAHPVRQAHELINVLVRGYIGRSFGPPSRFWRTEKFEVADLLDYLDGKSVLQTQHSAMVPTTRSISLNDRLLEFAQFAMDLTNMERVVTETYEAACESGAL